MIYFKFNINEKFIVYIRYLPVIFFMIFSACSYGNKDRLGDENCVLGVAAGASALVGWGFSEGAGWVAGEGYDFFNK